jgi:hypothetical protein
VMLAISFALYRLFWERWVRWLLAEHFKWNYSLFNDFVLFNR